MNEWKGKLSKKDAISIIAQGTDFDDPYWEHLVDNFYCEKTDTFPSIFHVFAALGVSEKEYKEATGADNVNWPNSDIIQYRTF